MKKNATTDGAFYGWKNIFILFVLYFIVLGIVFYGFSVIFPLMIKSLGWSRGDAASAHSIRGIMIGLLTPLTAWLLKSIGSRRTYLIGLLVCLLALMALGTVTTQLWHWILLWGFVMPVGFSLAGRLSAQTTAMFWFDRKRATVLGIVLSGSMIGGFAVSPLLTWLMKTTGSWQNGWLMCAGFIVVGLLILNRLHDKPSDLNQYPDGLDSPAHRTVPGQRIHKSGTYRTCQSWTAREAIRTKAVWLYALTVAGQLIPLYMIIVHGVLHLTDLGYSNMEAASLISFILIGGAVARFPMGVLADRIEPRWILTMCFVVMLPAYFIIWKAPSLPWVLTAAVGFGFSFGGATTVCSALLGNYFGPEAFAGINGLTMPAMVLISALIPAGAGYIVDVFGTYDPAFRIVIGIIGAALLAALFLSPPIRIEESEGLEQGARA